MSHGIQQISYIVWVLALVDDREPLQGFRNGLRAGKGMRPFSIHIGVPDIHGIRILVVYLSGVMNNGVSHTKDKRSKNVFLRNCTIENPRSELILD
jgi:hypothetical protein